MIIILLTKIITERTRRHNMSNIDQTNKSNDLPTLPSRFFQRMKFTQTNSIEEFHSNNVDDFFGSIWSLKSKVSNKSPDGVRKNNIYIFFYSLVYTKIPRTTIHVLYIFVL